MYTNRNYYPLYRRCITVTYRMGWYSFVCRAGMSASWLKSVACANPEETQADVESRLFRIATPPDCTQLARGPRGTYWALVVLFWAT